MRLLALVLLGACALAAASKRPVGDYVTDVIAAMNTSVNPCDDFYDYACGGWIAATPLPADAPAVFKAFGEIGDANYVVKAAILTNATGTAMGSLYASCMSTNFTDARGSEPLDAYLALVDSIQSHSDFMHVVGILQGLGIPALLSFSASQDAENPAMNIAQLTQGGIALPDRSLYAIPDLVQIYEAHVTDMFRLLGDKKDKAATEAAAVIFFETALANVSLNGDELLNPFSTYNFYNFTGFQALSSKLNWQSFTKGLNARNFSAINVATPTFFANLSIIVPTTDIYVLRSYLRWQLLHTMAPYLASPFVNATFEFFSDYLCDSGLTLCSNILEGQSEPEPLYQQCIDTIDLLIGDILGSLFYAAAFPGSSQTLANQMIAGIETAMHSNLVNCAWMDNTTRAAALTKLSLVGNQVGTPKDPDQYTGLHFHATHFFENALAAMSYTAMEFVNAIGQPADPMQWDQGMHADTINAYYDPTKNQMVFPAGILQSPYFSAERPTPLNFGGAGVIMGHELTHGFDDQGRDYNGYGKLTNWWQNATAAQFEARVGCIIDQYSQFEVLPGVYVNGNLTQGENIADCGGVKNSYIAYMAADPAAMQPSPVSGLSNLQLMFVGYAQGWCAVQSANFLKQQVVTDVHSPARFRVIGPLQNLPQFASTFNCPAGSYMNPTTRCSLW